MYKDLIKENKSEIIKLFIILICTVTLFVLFKLFDFNKNIYITLILIIYIFSIKDLIFSLIKNIKDISVINEKLLMIIASIGAIILSEYFEAIAVIFFYRLGELLEDISIDISKKSINDIADIRDEDVVLIKDSEMMPVKAKEIKEGDIILVKPGMRIVVDGVVVSGDSEIDKSVLTGESVPIHVSNNASVTSGSVNLRSSIYVKATKDFDNSYATMMTDFIKDKDEQRSTSEHFIKRFAKYYTPIVVISALLIFLIPSLITLQWSKWLYIGIEFLVISCPCALLISVPLSFFVGIGKISKNNILVKGSYYIERLSYVNHILLDKTGTITSGNFDIIKVDSKSLSKDELLNTVGQVEKNSTHPISKILSNKLIDCDIEVLECEEIKGLGIKAIIKTDKTHKVLIGSKRLLDKNNIKFSHVDSDNTVVYVAIDNEYEGYIVLGDKIKDDSKQAINEFRKMGINKLSLITGDNKDSALKVASNVGISDVKAELMPEDKLNIIREAKSVDTTMYVGDGINDSFALLEADIGVSMGELGSDLANVSSDVVLLNGKLTDIIRLIKFSGKIKRNVWENIIFAISVKVIIMILALFNISNLWVAAFADVGVMLIVVLNSLRIAGYKFK